MPVMADVHPDDRMVIDGEDQGGKEMGSGENEGEFLESPIDVDDDSENDQFRASSKFNQMELNDLIRDLRLSKDQSELLASRLKEKGCLDKRTIGTCYRNRDEHFRKYYDQHKSLVFCRDIEGLFDEFQVDHNSDNWRLFIDSSNRSLKAVLFNNGNNLASIPIAYSTILSENYCNMDYLLQKIDYSRYKWKICTDLKVVTILLGQQSGFTKYPCFLCE